MLTRRTFLAASSAGVVAAALAGTLPAFAQDADTLTIAFNVNLPSFDPTTGASAVNPTIQAIYRTVFDRMGLQRRQDQSFDDRARRRGLA